MVEERPMDEMYRFTAKGTAMLAFILFDDGWLSAEETEKVYEAVGGDQAPTDWTPAVGECFSLVKEAATKSSEAWQSVVQPEVKRLGRLLNEEDIDRIAPSVPKGPHYAANQALMAEERRVQ
jgi:hypothetical protein